MNLEDFITKHKLSGRATARILLVTEGAVRHWRDGSNPLPPSISLLLLLLDDYFQRHQHWP